MSETADLYRRWARVAARGSSPIYERLALAVAEDDGVLRLLESVEIGKRQPNLLFYDCWRYHYTGASVDRWIGPTGSPVTLSCQVDGDVPLPAAVPTIAWRVGLDLNPLNAREPAARRWLECLVWPEHHDRARTLPAALDVAVDVGPRIEKGNLVDDLPALIEQAPDDATLVVVHSATLFYLDQHDREAFTAMLARYGVHRLGCEDPGVVPELTEQLPTDIRGGRCLLFVDDRVLGLAHPHGRTLRWL